MKGSDILGMYVGETEQNIARAFRRAEAERAILFFDEVDGLLQDRSNATRSWEITQVNELLQQMESFGGIMVAATNFSKNLDPATSGPSARSSSTLATPSRTSTASRP